MSSAVAHNKITRPNAVAVGTIVWLSSELMFFAALFAMYFTTRAVQGHEIWLESTEILNIPFAVYAGLAMYQPDSVYIIGAAVVLEYFGYKTKVFEFITDAHTPKHIMIVGEKISNHKNEDALLKIKNAKEFFGIKEHYLENLKTRRFRY